MILNNKIKKYNTIQMSALISWINRDLTFINENVETIDANAFDEFALLSQINFPLCTTIGKNAFFGCIALTQANFPKCIIIKQSAFAQCENLSQVNFPLCKTIGMAAFYNCLSLIETNFPVCTEIDSYAFYSCLCLSQVSFPVCTVIKNAAFQRCTSLMSLYLLGSSIVTLTSENAFYDTPISDSTFTGNFGNIYVPIDLYNEYKITTNWIQYADRFVSVS